MEDNSARSEPTDPVADIFRLAEQNQVLAVDLKFSGLLGRWHHVTLPASRFRPELFRNGVGFDGSSSPGFARIEASDMLLVPDASTGFMDPFWEAPTLSLICRIHDARTGQPASIDPRETAVRAEAYMAAGGIADRCLMSPEFEFYIFDSVRHHCDVQGSFHNVDSVEGAWNTGSDREATDLPALGMPLHGG